MILPLLHLLQRGDRPARIHAVAQMVAARPDSGHARPAVPGEMLFLSGGDAEAGDMALAEIVRRHPRLATLRGPCRSEALQAGGQRLLVIGFGIADMTPAILEAMAAGVLVVSPDDGMGADLVHDGINGFHYRARNPDSLALALLTLERLPADGLQAILARARATCNAVHPCLPDGPSHLPQGEPA